MKANQPTTTQQLQILEKVDIVLSTRTGSAPGFIESYMKKNYFVSVKLIWEAQKKLSERAKKLEVRETLSETFNSKKN